MKLFKIKEKEYYYNLADIDKTGATYKIIIGKRSNGKTHAVMERIIREYFKSGLPSVYLRRYDTDIKSVAMKNIISTDLCKLIEKLSHKKYNTVVYKAKKLYLAKYDKLKDKIITSPNVLLYAYALNTWEHEKGGDIGDIFCLCFDEFLTRQAYLTDEFILFANVISSVKRDRKIEVYMLGNTVNKFCPYWSEMGLYDIENQKQGTICIYTYNSKSLTVAVEYCSDSENTKSTDYYFAFDNPALDMIKKGTWEESNYRHLKERYTKEDIYYTFYIKFSGHYIKGTVFKREKSLFIFYNSETKKPDITENDIFYTDEPIKSLYHSNSFGIWNSKKQHLVYNLMKQHRDYYSNNTVGEIVNNFIKEGEKNAIWKVWDFRKK